MSGPYTPQAGNRSRRPQDTGSSLAVSRLAEAYPAHATAIEQSHERCQVLGLSRIERPDHSVIGRSDLTVAANGICASIPTPRR